MDSIDDAMARIGQALGELVEHSENQDMAHLLFCIKGGKPCPAQRSTDGKCYCQLTSDPSSVPTVLKQCQYVSPTVFVCQVEELSFFPGSDIHDLFMKSFNDKMCISYYSMSEAEKAEFRKSNPGIPFGLISDKPVHECNYRPKT